MGREIKAPIQTWAAIGYSIGSQVNKDGIDYVANAATISTDVPGISTKWTERLTSVAGLMNMYHYANESFDKWLQFQYLFPSIQAFPYFYSQVGTNTVEKLSNYEGFTNAWKFSMPNQNNRINMFSASVDITTSPIKAGDKMFAGIFVKKIAGATFNYALGIIYGNNQGVMTPTTEIVEIGNGWVYIRTVEPMVLFANNNNQITMLFYLYNTVAGQGQFVVAAPTLAKADRKLLPMVYSASEFGLKSEIDANKKAISEVNSTAKFNVSSDENFDNQTIVSPVWSPYWEIATGGPSRYAANFNLEESLNPIGSKTFYVSSVRRSSDGFNSDRQLFNKFLIPSRFKKDTKISGGVFGKWDSSKVGVMMYFYFYSDLNYATFISSANNGSSLPVNTGADYVLAKFENITIPNGTQSIKMMLRVYSLDAAVLDAVNPGYFSSFLVNFGATLNCIPFNLAEKIVPTHDWVGKVFSSFGDSMTAGGVWQAAAKEKLGTTNYVRGCGSSAVTFDIGLMAVSPDGNYIARRNVVADDAAFDAAILAAGFTNLVTTPTWTNYAANPTAYTLPANSFFKINTQASSQDRVNTIPLDSNLVSVFFGTNDFTQPTIGAIDDYNVATFIGQYRLMLERIKVRVPNARVVLCVPPRRTEEWDDTLKKRNASGVLMDNLRQSIRDIGKVYGYTVVDFTEVINFANLNLISDGVHLTTAGNNEIGNLFAKKLMSVPKK